ncbi:hypothetical protein MLD38_030501 [Melastoma candidum]|uniref:Uncharacterized protein n=1 Tax=Melastoma candidum TaxID=119954 RepID=A0ACB9MLY1_9MYRT|nr:hypothetical protein MLD38_030501 [Melastoma candidum]
MRRRMTAGGLNRAAHAARRGPERGELLARGRGRGMAREGKDGEVGLGEVAAEGEGGVVVGAGGVLGEIEGA